MACCRILSNAAVAAMSPQAFPVPPKKERLFPCAPEYKSSKALRKMLSAALWSRSRMSPQPGQMCVRIERDALFDPLAVGAFLAGEVRFHRQYRDSVEHPIVLHPAQ